MIDDDDEGNGRALRIMLGLVVRMSLITSVIVSCCIVRLKLLLLLYSSD